MAIRSVICDNQTKIRLKTKKFAVRPNRDKNPETRVLEFRRQREKKKKRNFNILKEIDDRKKQGSMIRTKIKLELIEKRIRGSKI